MASEEPVGLPGGVAGRNVPFCLWFVMLLVMFGDLGRVVATRNPAWRVSGMQCTPSVSVISQDPSVRVDEQVVLGAGMGFAHPLEGTTAVAYQRGEVLMQDCRRICQQEHIMATQIANS